MTDAQPKTRQRRPVVVPDLNALPDHTLLTRNQLVQLTSFSLPTLKIWAKQNKGPKVTYVEGHPRYLVGDTKTWMTGSASGAEAA